MFLIVYVDDIVLIGNSQSAAEKMISFFREIFEIRVSQKIEKFFCITV